MRIEIPVAMLEFDEGGQTLWVHGTDGTTVLRVKARSGIEINSDFVHGYPYCDIYVEGKLTIYMPPSEEKESK